MFLRKGRRLGEDGFSISEVLVALSLLAIVTLGTVPLFISGLRATLVSRLDTGAKNLSQERFEIMRNLPFHLDISAASPAGCSAPTATPTSPAGCNFKDLLDTYYRSLQPAASSTQPGFVTAASTARRAGEPATGAFYRFVINPVPGFGGAYSQFIASQFLNINRAPVTPPATYNSQTPGADGPPSKLLGVTVITQWRAGSRIKTFTNFSQIAEGIAIPPKITTQARSSAVRINTTLASGSSLRLEAGLSSSDGSAASGANAATQDQSLFARVNPGTSIEGILSSFSAPDNTSSTTGAQTPQTLTVSGSTVATSVGGSVANVSATTALDLPKVASSASPSTGRVSKAASAGAVTFSLNNIMTGDALAPALIGLLAGPVKPAVRSNEELVSNFPALGSTYLDSSTGAGHFAEANASAHTQNVKLLETNFAPEGLVQMRLDSASLTCRSTGAVLTPTASFSGTVRYLRATATPGVNEYISVPISPTQSLDPAILTNASSVVWTSSAATVPLSTYILNWGSLTAATVASNTSERSITASLSGIISVTTQPLRTTDPSSTVGVELGVLSCFAQDTR